MVKLIVYLLVLIGIILFNSLLEVAADKALGINLEVSFWARQGHYLVYHLTGAIMVLYVWCVAKS
jgi:hypothetical protein